MPQINFDQVGNFKSVADFDAIAERQAANRLQQLMLQAQFDRGQRGDADEAAWRKVAAGFTGDVDADFRAGLKVDPKRATELRKTGYDALKERNLAQKARIETRDKTTEYYQRLFDTNVRDTGSARKFLMHSYTDPDIGPELERHGALEDKLREVPDSTANPRAFAEWRANVGIGIKKMAELRKVNNVNLGGTMETQATDPATGQVTTLSSSPITQSANNIENAKVAREGIAAGLGATTYMDTAGGIVALPTRRGPGAPSVAAVQTPGAPAGTPLQAPQKEIPAGEMSKLREAKGGLTNLDAAIEAVKKNPSAFGMTNALPGAEKVKQYTDPKGIEARAMVANIGSLVLHDRSGAAVSISEFPRLAPFIPSASDRADAVLKKLKKMKQIAEEEYGLFVEIYSPSRGYKPNPLLQPPPQAEPVAPGAASRAFKLIGRVPDSGG